MGSLHQLVAEFNDYLKIDSDGKVKEIAPDVVGVVFTMIQINSGMPINAQRPFMNQTKQLGIPVFDKYFRENKSIFGESPQYGIPVALIEYNNPTHSSVVEEIDEFIAEFIAKVGLKRYG
jgi:chromosome partitioning protein